jgi:hypothetical protein
MVIGLVEGLGQRFETPVDVEQLACRSEGADHDVFAVHYGDPSERAQQQQQQQP